VLASGDGGGGVAGPAARLSPLKAKVAMLARAQLLLFRSLFVFMLD